MTLQCGLVRFISSIYNNKRGRAAVYTLYSTLGTCSPKQREPYYGLVDFISQHRRYQWNKYHTNIQHFEFKKKVIT